MLATWFRRRSCRRHHRRRRSWFGRGTGTLICIKF